MAKKQRENRVETGIERDFSAEILLQGRDLPPLICLIGQE